MTKMKLLTLAAAAALMTLPVAGAFATAADQAPAAQVQPESKLSVSEEKLQAYVNAHGELSALDPAGKTAEEVQSAQAAILQKHGLTAEEFTSISGAIQANPELQESANGQ